jgi:hypothetical protein
MPSIRSTLVDAAPADELPRGVAVEVLAVRDHSSVQPRQPRRPPMDECSASDSRRPRTGSRALSRRSGACSRRARADCVIVEIMSVAAVSPRHPHYGRRVGLALAAVSLASVSAWFAASWIDTAYDSTCGSAFTPSIWLGASVRDRCEPVMGSRVAIAAVLAIAAVILLVGAARSWRGLLNRAWAILAACIGLGAVIVTVNEAVRSGGMLS